jgi:hypothetical protein
MKYSLLFLCSIVMAFSCAAQVAQAAVDPAAAVVMVRKSCTDNGVALDDCFTTMADLTDWMATARKPNAQTPLHVDIGPGKFSGDIFITCDPGNNYTGYTAFEGAGIGQTILYGHGSGNNSPVTINSCTELSFAHLKIQGSFYGGVEWGGGGNSKWDDVEVIGNARAWYESSCGATGGSHYWFGSKLTATALTFAGIADTYDASCDESWFFGSEVTVSVPTNAYQASGGAVVAHGNGIIHLYGSVLRTLIDGPTTGNNVPAASASSGGVIHIHGTGIDAISTTGKNVTALYAGTGGMIHAPATAYNLSTTGTITRISNNGGNIMAPYMWQENASPQNIVSTTGADTQVVTNNPDGHPHLAVYDNSCTSKWFDTVTGACR